MDGLMKIDKYDLINKGINSDDKVSVEKLIICKYRRRVIIRLIIDAILCAILVHGLYKVFTKGEGWPRLEDVFVITCIVTICNLIFEIIRIPTYYIEPIGAEYGTVLSKTRKFTGACLVSVSLPGRNGYIEEVICHRKDIKEGSPVLVLVLDRKAAYAVPAIRKEDCI